MKIQPLTCKKLKINKAQLEDAIRRGFKAKEILQTVIWKYGKNWIIEEVMVIGGNLNEMDYSNKYLILPKYINKLVEIK